MTGPSTSPATGQEGRACALSPTMHALAKRYKPEAQLQYDPPTGKYLLWLSRFKALRAVLREHEDGSWTGRVFSYFEGTEVEVRTGSAEEVFRWAYRRTGEDWRGDPS